VVFTWLLAFLTRQPTSLRLRVFIVTVIGCIPTEHASIEKLVGVIWIMEVHKTTVAHDLKPFYRMSVLDEE